MVAPPHRRAYNRRSKSSGLGDVDWLVNALEPLGKGMTKVLVMETPAIPRKGVPAGSTRKQLVALAPGEIYGFKARSVLVSVVGAGSCVIDPMGERQLTGLLRAGMPLPLAKALFSGLARIYRSTTHGTTDPTHTGAQPRRPRYPRTGRTFHGTCAVLRVRTDGEPPAAAPPRRRR